MGPAMNAGRTLGNSGEGSSFGSSWSSHSPFPTGRVHSNRKILDKVPATRECPFCDLADAKLTGADLSGGRLSGTKLIGANLSKAELSGASLAHAKLSGADLSGADLRGAYWIDGKKCKEGSIGECKKDSGSEKGSGKGRGSHGGMHGLPGGQ